MITANENPLIYERATIPNPLVVPRKGITFAARTLPQDFVADGPRAG